jgi:hypothetical protein
MITGIHPMVAAVVGAEMIRRKELKDLSIVGSTM